MSDLSSVAVALQRQSRLAARLPAAVLVSAAFLVALALAMAFPHVVTPYDPLVSDVAHAMQAPSRPHGWQPLVRPSSTSTDATSINRTFSGHSA